MATFLGRIRKLQDQLDIINGKTERMRNMKEIEVSLLMEFLERTVKEEMVIYINRRYAIQLNRNKPPDDLRSCIVYDRRDGDYWQFDDLPIQVIEDIESNLTGILNKVIDKLQERLAERSNGQIGQREMFGLDE